MFLLTHPFVLDFSSRVMGISCTEHKERQDPSMLSCTWGPFILFLSRCLKTTGAPKRARFPSNMLVPSSRVPQRSHPIGDTQAAHVVFISIVSLLFGFPHFRQAREGVMELRLQHLASNSFLSSKSDILRLLYSSSPLLSLSLLHLPTNCCSVSLPSLPFSLSHRSWNAAELDLTCPPCWKCFPAARNLFGCRTHAVIWPFQFLSSVWGSLHSQRSSSRPSRLPSVLCTSTKSWTR